MKHSHTPVLLAEVLAALAVKADGVYVDATFGRGGHSAAILKELGNEGRLIALDRDPEAIASGRELFGSDARVRLINTPFSALQEVVDSESEGRSIDGLLFDLGVSSPQLDEPTRGFSFSADGPLDMRMDPKSGQSAAEWLATASERDISAVIRKFGEERFARRIAKAIVERRGTRPVVTTGELADIVRAAVPAGRDSKRIHPATRTFQAIRIFINDELGELERALSAALGVLAPGGRLAVISFHSLEDRIVKRFIRRHASEDPAYRGLPDIPEEARPTLRSVGKKRRAGTPEVESNPRARSALLRVAERLP